MCFLRTEWLPIIQVFQRGIEQKILKDADKHILGAYMFHPVSRLANQRLCEDFVLDEKGLELAFTMAWDAIKL